MCLFASAAAALILLVSLIIFFFVLRSPIISITKLSYDSSKKLEMRKGGAIIPSMLEVEINNPNYFGMSFTSFSAVVSPAGMRDRKGKYVSNNLTVEKTSVSKVTLPIKIPLRVDVIKKSCLGSKKQFKMNVTIAFDFKMASSTGSQNFTTPVTVECPIPLQNPRLVEVLTTGKLSTSPRANSKTPSSRRRTTTNSRKPTTATRTRSATTLSATRVVSTRNRTAQRVATIAPSPSVTHRMARPRTQQPRGLNSLPVAGHAVRKWRL
jgi:hypothetical protein